VTSVTLAVAAFDVLAIGLLAELIEKRSPAFSAADFHAEPGTKLHREHAIGQPKALSRAELHGRTRPHAGGRVNAPAFATAVDQRHSQPYADLWQGANAQADAWSSFTFAAEPDDPTVQGV
jgi:hypothetical protein